MPPAGRAPRLPVDRSNAADPPGGERRTEYRLSHRLYSAAELSGLLRDVGFTTVTPSGDLAGAPYDPTAKRLVLVGRR